MKIRIMSVLLLVAMIFSMIVAPVQKVKATQDPATTGKNAPIDFATSTVQDCPGCGSEGVTWLPLPQITTETVLAAGHYYVPAEGVSNTAQYTFNSNANRCIHLNSSTVTSTTRLFTITNNARIRIFGSGTVTTNTGKKVSDGAFAYLSTARLYLYGGNYTVTSGTPFYLSSSGSNAYLYAGASVSGGTAGNVYMKNGTFSMYGGTISGGSNTNGGNVSVAGGTFNMYGGTISGGSATNGGNVYVSGGTFQMPTSTSYSGGTVSDGSATNGGNLYLTSAATFSMSTGLISGGEATRFGGNIHAEGNTFTVSGNVTDGVAGSSGGNISVGTGSVLTVTGTVSGGTVEGTGGGDWGGNIRAWQSTVNIESGAMIYGGSGGGKPAAANIGCLSETDGAAAVLNINGGTVTGDIYTTAPGGTFAGTQVKLTGSVNIVRSVTVDGVTYSATKCGLYLLSGVVADVSGMTGGSVYFSGENGQAMTAATENAALLDGCFYAYKSSQQITLADNVFTLQEKENAGVSDFAPWDNEGKAQCPVCKAEKTWTATGGSGNIGEKADGTHLYLNQNHDATGLNQVLSVAENATVCLNLNGMTLSMDGRIVIAKAGATLNIMDTSADGTGVITSTGTRTDHAYYKYTLMNQNDGVINLYGGTFRNTNSEAAIIRTNVASAEVNIYDGAVIDGNNQTRGIYMVNGTVNVNGGIIKNGNRNGYGGNIYMETGKLNIQGGKVMGGIATNGGNIYIAGGTAKVTDDGDPNTNLPQLIGGTATTGNGGSIYSAVALTMDAGTVSGGVATAGNGGNIYCVGNLSLGSCTISNGKATAGNGGNVAIVGTSSAKAACDFGEGMLISGGKAKNGGNVYISYATVDMTAGEISGGNATGRSGNFEVSGSATLNLEGGLIDGGTAGANGGNLYTSSTTSRVTMTGGTVSNGTSTNSGTGTGGGNFYINNGYLTVNGGVISGGKAPNAYGGNIYSKTGGNSTANKVVIDDDGDPNTPKPLITGGVSKYTGGNIYINGDRYSDKWSYITLGDCEIANGDSTSYAYGDDISLQHSGRLTLKSNFSATNVDIYIPNCCVPAVRMGGVIEATAIITEGVFPGTLVMEQFTDAHLLVGKEGSTRAFICDTGILHADGSYTWLTDNAQMVAAVTEGGVIQANAGEMVLSGGEYVVDLRGNSVHFSGSGTVTLIDSTNASYETFGTATADPAVTVQTGIHNVGQKSYCVLNDNGTYSAHCVDFKLIKVSLRPSAGGIYFTGKWECDGMLADHIEDFGVAVSAVDAPGTDFKNDGHSLWSYYEKSEFENGVEKTGVLITGILKDTNADRISKNAEYAQTPIHAAAYLTVDGESFVGSAMSFSLHDVLSILNDQIDVYYKKASVLQSFMQTWKEKGLSGDDWSFRYTPCVDAVNLNEAYADRTAFHGEFHDHADTGGKSDGRASLSRIKEYMDEKDIDFTTILDHYQILHMELDDWDSKLFIGGSEFGTIITDGPETGNSLHVNMLFTDPEEFKDLMMLHNPGNKYGTAGKFTWHLDEASGNYYYDEHKWNIAELTQLIEDIRICGGMYVFPHPKDGTRYISDNPIDYWFADWVGLEVFYGPSYYAPTNARTANAYKLWVDLLEAGKKIWATAGSDSHNVPNTNALTTIYSTQKNAVEHFEHAKQGDMTCGPVGIRMCMGDTLTGGETSFAGERLSICVSDFHSSVIFEDHTYSVKVIAGKNGEESIVCTQNIDPQTLFYYGLDADATCDYYRVEVYDESDTRIIENLPIAIGNPIWNKK